MRVVSHSLFMMFLVQAASGTWISSLSHTSVSVNTAIYNINPLLVYVFSIPILSETFSVTKASAVFLALIATSVVAQGTTFEPQEQRSGLVGPMTVLLSATIYSLKEVR